MFQQVASAFGGPGCNTEGYRLLGISRSIVGVDVPEPGVDAIDISESVRFMAFAIVIWTGCRRGWKMGAGIGGDILLQEPSR